MCIRDRNGGFRKRRRGGLDLELSDDDEDDEELREYHKRKRELMKKRMLEIGDDKKLIKNPKSKAFFESMVEDIVDEKNAFGDIESIEKSSTELDTQEEKEQDVTPGVDKKKNVISEEFVQKTLSFLRSGRDLEEFNIEEDLAKEQHGENVEDLFSLKQRSTIKEFRNPSQTNTIDLINNVENVESSPLGGFKPPSVIKSFSSRTDINEKFKDGNKTVTISKVYKTVGSSKASITYLGKSRKLMPPKKNKNREKIGSKIKPTRSSLFSSHDESFENS